MVDVYKRQEGKRDVTSDIFEFNGSEFTYDGNTHSPNITTKNNIKGVGTFSVKSVSYTHLICPFRPYLRKNFLPEIRM